MNTEDLDLDLLKKYFAVFRDDDDKPSLAKTVDRIKEGDFLDLYRNITQLSTQCSPLQP